MGRYNGLVRQAVKELNTSSKTDKTRAQEQQGVSQAGRQKSGILKADEKDKTLDAHVHRSSLLTTTQRFTRPLEDRGYQKNTGCETRGNPGAVVQFSMW